MREASVRIRAGSAPAVFEAARAAVGEALAAEGYEVCSRPTIGEIDEDNAYTVTWLAKPVEVIP